MTSMAMNDLPSVVPVFPLTGCTLIPGSLLPLHIFEPRYRNMVQDSLDGERLIGMIQPLVPRNDNSAPSRSGPDKPELYPIGGIGSIERYLRGPDGRYHILLRGVVRFRTVEEMPLQREYRRFRIRCDEFVRDMQPADDFSLDPRLVEVLDRLGWLQESLLNWRGMSGTQAAQRGDWLVSALPWGPAEKQALLEAADAQERERRLLVLLAMERHRPLPDDPSLRLTVQ